MPEKEGLWTTILANAASSKKVTVRNVLVLGEANSGKSTVIKAISQTTLQDINAQVQSTRNASELALAYSYFDVDEEESDDVSARIGIFQLSGDANHESLIPFALTTETLAESIALIILDWNKPWDFFKSLQKWLNILEKSVEFIAAKDVGLLDKLKQNVEQFFTSYTEPVTGADGAAIVTTDTIKNLHDIVIPLAPGLLSNNIGIPLIVVCTKSDSMTLLEREHNYNEEQFDFIQQSLRTICLKYGASLFYISKYKPTTLLNLRNYILHRLFASSEIHFPYNLKSQVIDRDSVMVPIGWDSWGKIKALRDEFDVEDFEYEKKVVPYTTVGNSLSIQSEIIAEDEQAFLGRQLEVLNSMGGKVVAPNSPKIDSLEDISAKLAKLSKLKESSSPSTPIRERKSGIDIDDDNAAPSPSAQNEVLANFFQNLLTKKSSPTPSNE